MELVTQIREYLATVDSSLDQLSHNREGSIAGLPGWTLIFREISVGETSDGQGVVVQVRPNEDLTSDTIRTFQISTRQDVLNLMSPFQAGFSLEHLGHHPFMVIFGDTIISEDGNPFIPPFVDPCIRGFGGKGGAMQVFSNEKAKMDAIEMWNRALYMPNADESFIREMKSIFQKLKNLINQKSFKERRIHRFIHEHSNVLLPNHTKVYFEHVLRLGGEIRKADFILEREAGFPALLIELEAPTHNIFRKNGNLTAQANHAREQIAEWVQFIDSDAQRNASGEHAFLSGPKQRLVIMGRHLAQKDKMLSTKFQDTSFWTYDLLLEQAKMRWNNQIATQAKLLGLGEVSPF